MMKQRNQDGQIVGIYSPFSEKLERIKEEHILKQQQEQQQKGEKQNKQKNNNGNSTRLDFE